MNVQTFHFSGTHANHPDEDALAWHGNRFAVFDGVTLAHQQPYPDPSPAAAAARAGCRAILDTPQHQGNPEQILRAMAHQVTQAIRQVNDSLGITPDSVDFLKVQYAAAVGAFGYIDGQQLYCAQLTDCEVLVLDQTGQVVFRLEGATGPVNAYLDSLRQSGRFVASSPEEHQFVRGQVINNLHVDFGGTPIRVGVFTGQDSAEQFVRTGQHTLRPGDTVLFLSDGMLPLVDDPDFRGYLATSTDFADFDQRQNRVSDMLSERSLLLVRPDLMAEIR